MKHLFNMIMVAFMLPTINWPSYAQQRQVQLGDSLYRQSGYLKASEHYEKGLRRTDGSPEVQEKLANTYYYLKDYSRSFQHYRMAWVNQLEWTPESRENYLEVLRILHKDEELAEVIHGWQKLDIARKMESGIESEALYYMDSVVYSIGRLEVNSEASDFSPAYYKDGLVFTSSRAEGNTGSRKFAWDGSHYLNLFYAPLAGAAPQVSTIGTNTVFHDGMACFYQYGTKVIFTRNESSRNDNGKRQLILMQADVDFQGQWFNIRELPFNDPSYSISHPAITQDGQTLYFVSNMKGGYGETDIYRVRKSGDGWGKPENLGPSVNTSGREMFPTVYGDELIFASDGHPGMGGLDIYEAEPLSDDAFLVHNAGYPINTSSDDFGLITKDGRQGYFSSDREGQDDIYRFVKDRVIVDLDYIDSNNRELLDSVATLRDNKLIMPLTGKKVTHLYLTPNSSHDLVARKDGYADTTFQVRTEDQFYMTRTIPMNELSEEVRKLIDVYPISTDGQIDYYLGLPDRLLPVDYQGTWTGEMELKIEGKRAGNQELDRLKDVLDHNGYDAVVHQVIRSIHFDFDKSFIRTGEADNLNRLIELLKKYPSSRLMIAGHADERGSNPYNDRLSLRRASATADYLVAHGIDPSRIDKKGYGKRKLLIVCDECTEELHQMNRRVNFSLEQPAK